jgi:CheY-like chemotaxis protein
MPDATGPIKFRILLCEDNAADVFLIRHALADAGIETELTVLDDGAAALAFVRKHEAGLNGEVPDLAILDLNLPKHTGLEILQAMRAGTAFSGMPVMVLSSSSAPRDLERLNEFRVDRYITKPADLDEFMKIGHAVKGLLTTEPRA